MLKQNTESVLFITVLCLVLGSFGIFFHGTSYSGDNMAKIIGIIEEVRAGNEERVSELIKIGTEAVPILIPYMEDENPLVREDVIIVIGEIGAAQAVPEICVHLEDSDSNVRRRAIDVLSKLEPFILKERFETVLSPLLEYIKRADENSYKAALIIGNIGDDLIIDELKLVLKQIRIKGKGRGGEAIIDKKVENACLKALAKLNDPEAISEILSALKSKEVSTRLAAIETIMYIGRKDMARHLIVLLDDKEEALNIAPSGGKYYLRITDMAVNVIGEIYRPSLSFKIERGMRYTDKQIEEVKEWIMNDQSKF